MSNSRTVVVFSLEDSCFHNVSNPAPGVTVQLLALPFSLVLICITDADAPLA